MIQKHVEKCVTKSAMQIWEETTAEKVTRKTTVNFRSMYYLGYRKQDRMNTIIRAGKAERSSIESCKK